MVIGEFPENFNNFCFVFKSTHVKAAKDMSCLQLDTNPVEIDSWKIFTVMQSSTFQQFARWKNMSMCHKGVINREGLEKSQATTSGLVETRDAVLIDLRDWRKGRVVAVINSTALRLCTRQCETGGWGVQPTVW